MFFACFGWSGFRWCFVDVIHVLLDIFLRYFEHDKKHRFLIVFFYEKHYHLFFDHARWCWLEATPFLAYLAKEGRKWITKHTSLPPPPPSGISFGIKLRHKKRRFSYVQSSIRQLQLINGVVKSWWRLTKIALIVVPNQWNQLNTSFIVAHWLNKDGDMLPTSFGNFLQIRGTLACGSHFTWCNVCLIYLYAKHFNGSMASGYF